MRKVLLGAAAALAVAAPGVANAGTQGSIDLSYESTDYDSSEFNAVQLGGAIVHDLGGNMTVQGDGQTSLQSWDGDDDDYSHAYGAAHLFWDVGGADVGGFAGLLNYYGDGGKLLGAEARTAFGNFSLDGYASVFDFEDWADGNSFGIGGAFFVMPNFEINAAATRTDIDTSFDEDEITELSLGAAYQFANHVELYGGYTNTDGEDDFSDWEADTWKIGLRFNIGGGTLQDNRNDGAFGSAETVSDIFMRW